MGYVHIPDLKEKKDLRDEEDLANEFFVLDEAEEIALLLEGLEALQLRKMYE